MPSDYIYVCDECGWENKRYRNLKICPECRAPVHRKPEKVLCFHGTDKGTSELIRKNGFKPDSWFACHMEDALSFGKTILTVEFESDKIPKGWQFHVKESVPPSKIISIQEVTNE
ncbi:MAG: hypothetical protein WC455_24610 [Dehalococcoidia bacterium]|jgi:hypothetical protein